MRPSFRPGRYVLPALMAGASRVISLLSTTPVTISRARPDVSVVIATYRFELLADICLLRLISMISARFETIFRLGHFA